MERIGLIVVLLFVGCTSEKNVKKATFPTLNLEEICSSNSEACLKMGESAEKKEEIDRAISFFESACELKNAMGCLHAGRLQLEENQVPKAKNNFIKACKLKDSSACYGVGMIASGLYGGQENLREAKTQFQLACGMGLIDGCAQGAMIWIQKSANNREERKKAIKYLKLTCTGSDKFPEARSDLACFSLGEFFRDTDPKQSQAWFEEACSLGDGAACLSVGLSFLGGEEKSNSDAYRFFEKGCLAKEKDWMACSFYGYTNFKNAQNAQNNEDKIIAKKLLIATCEHNAEGCFRMALIDNTESKWLEKACMMNAERCETYRKYIYRTKEK